MIRRSVSSWLSPGPRVPIPPPVRLKVGPEAGQARQLVLELRELDLEAALVGLRMEREDVEDQAAPVDHLDLEELLERALLGGRQLVVGDQDVEPGLALGRDEILRLALADIPVGVDVAAVLPFGADHVGTGRGGQAGELGERILGRPAVFGAGIHGHEERLFDGRCEIDHVGGHVRGRIAVRGWTPRAMISRGRRVSLDLASVVEVQLHELAHRSHSPGCGSRGDRTLRYLARR